MKTIAWTMTADTAMEFFSRCHERGAVTEVERAKVLAELAREGKMTSVTASKKTKEEFLQDKAKRFNVIKVGKKRETN